jgi:hypothetical protein
MSAIQLPRSSGADVAVISEFRECERRGHENDACMRAGIFAAATQLPERTVYAFSKAPFVVGLIQNLALICTVLFLRNFRSNDYGVYFPQQKAKAGVFDFFLNGVPSVHAGPQLVVGDFNTGLHRVDEMGATFHCADKMQAMTSGGYIDCWRSRNPDARAFTWYSSARNGFRIDHAFANAAVDSRIRKIAYDHTPREAACTDHSALVVEVGSA